MRQRNPAASRGNSIAELGPTLLICFFVFAFPLAALGSTGLKYVFFMNAAKQSADAGSKCKFWNMGGDAPMKLLCGCERVNNVVDAAVKGFSGVQLEGKPELSVCSNLYRLVLSRR